jgi:hypothetical protein
MPYRHHHRALDHLPADHQRIAEDNYRKIRRRYRYNLRRHGATIRNAAILSGAGALLMALILYVLP